MPEPRSHLIDLTPFRVSPAFARLWTGNTLAGIGTMVTGVAISLHIYALTQSTFAVSLVAWFSIVPMMLAGLYGGAIADRFDRRIVAIAASFVAWVSTLALLAATWLGWTVPALLYVVATINAVAGTIASAARGAIVPRLVPQELLAKASAIGGVGMGLVVTVGPGLAGVLVAQGGFHWTYAVDLGLFFAGFFGLLTLPPIRPDGAHKDVSPLRSVADGLAFLRGAPNVRTSFVVDIIAMTFGQPLVVFPAVCALLLGGGPVTVGLLTASFAVGAILSSLVSGRLTSIRAQGRAIRTAIIAYGAAIAALGIVLAWVALSGTAVASNDLTTVHGAGLVASCVCMAAAGGADNISSIFRQAILQAAVPDALRGRIQGIFIAVVTGGPRVGQMFAGTLATVTTLWMPALAGGLLVILGVIVAVARVPSFRDYDSHDPRP